MELDDIYMDIDWAEDILNNITSSMLANPTDRLQQVNVSNVQDSVGAVAVTTNQAQNTEHTFDFVEEATSSSMGSQQLLVDDHNQLPQLSPDFSPPLLNAAQSIYHSSSMVGLNSELGAVSSFQGQDMPLTSGLNQISLMQNNNLHLTHGLDWRNKHTTSHDELLGPNVLTNHNFSEINHQSSSYPTLFQQNLVEAGTGMINEHLMANKTSLLFPSNDHAINQHRMWNSPRSLLEPDQRNEYNQLLDAPSFQQQNSTINGPTALASTFHGSSELSSSILGVSGSRTTEETISQMFSTKVSDFAGLLRPESASSIQLQQMAPHSTNIISTQRGDVRHPQSSSSRTQTSVPIINIPNQNDRVMVTSSGPCTTIQQDPSLNLQYGRAEKGQQPTPRRGRPPKKYVAGESSLTSKRRKKGSSGIGNAGKTPMSNEANNTENVVTQHWNTNPTNPSSHAPNERPFQNELYHMEFENNGFPIDPHLRLFKALSEKHAGPTTTKL